MSVRPPFIYALVATWILFIVVSLVQSYGHINDYRQLLATSGKSSAVTGGHVSPRPSSDASGAALLNEVLAQTPQFDVTFHRISYMLPDNAYTIECHGQESNLLAFYAWFEKEAPYTALMHMELSGLDDVESEAKLSLSVRVSS